MDFDLNIINGIIFPPAQLMQRISVIRFLVFPVVSTETELTPAKSYVYLPTVSNKSEFRPYYIFLLQVLVIYFLMKELFVTILFEIPLIARRLIFEL